MVITIATGLLIGLVLGMVFQSILFLIAYNPVRSYAGGYHAGSQLICYLLSVPMMAAVLLGIKMLPWSGYLFAAALISAASLIEILAPVEDSHKPLNDREKVVYKRRTRIYTVILTGLAIVLWFAGMQQISLSIVMALGVAAVMLVLGTVKNRGFDIEKA